MKPPTHGAGRRGARSGATEQSDAVRLAEAVASGHRVPN